jgi:hypothetical protein
VPEDFEREQLDLEVLAFDEEALVVPDGEPDRLPQVQPHRARAVRQGFDARRRLRSHLGRLIGERRRPDHGVRLGHRNPVGVAEVGDAPRHQQT